MIKRLIFDIDDTLIPSDSYKVAITKTLKYFGIYSEENYKAFCDIGTICEKMYNCYEKKKYLALLNKSLSSSLDESFFDVHFKNLEDTAPNDNEKIRHVIEKLHEKYELVLLSNYFESAQRRRLARGHLSEYFEEYYGEVVTKPNREVFIAACGNHEPSECVMIGDNPITDIEAAIDCGLKAIFVKGKNGRDLDFCPTISTVEELTEKVIESLNDR